VKLALKLCWGTGTIRFVVLDGYPQVVVLFAFSKEGTSLFQRLELLLGIAKLIHLEVKLAKIFVRRKLQVTVATRRFRRML
jgi:hypothetical protein